MRYFSGMAETDVAAFERALEAWNRGDVEGWVACFEPEGEWVPGMTEVNGGNPIVGRDEIRQAWADLREAFEQLIPEYDEVTDTGEAVLAFGRLLGRSRTGVPIDVEYAVVARYRDGLATSVRSYGSHEQAREAAGLSP